MVSRGGVLRNLHLDSIGWYYLRCSYGVARNESYDPTIHTEAYSEAIHGKSKGKTKTVLDYHDNCEVVEGRIHWLYKYNVRVKAGTRVSVRGWIGAPLHGPISITQILYRSKHETRDSLPVKDPNIDIDVVAKLVWEIDDVEGMGYRERNPRNRRWYQALEYEILMPFDPSSSRVIMIIPDGGKFPDEESWGENFQCREAKVQLAPAVFATPAPVEPGATGQAAASGGPQRNKPRARVRPSESQLGPRRSERQADPHREMLSRVGPYWSGPSRWTTNCGRNA